MPEAPTFLPTLGALFRGHLPRLIQGRGWVLAALALLPPGVALLVFSLMRDPGSGPALALNVYHQALVAVALPVMALIAAPAGVREDLESRTLPLMLVRPAPAWALPFGKGLPWFAWGSLWLMLASALLIPLSRNPEAFPRQAAALVLGFWAELAFLTLLGLLLKRGTLWGALWFFLLDPLVRVLPAKLQLFTFLHHLQRIAGSRRADLSTQDLLAQAPAETPIWVCASVLLAVGCLGWVLAGLKVWRTPYGLAGRDAEG